MSPQHLPRKGLIPFRHLLRRAGSDDPPAAGASFRAQVDDPVGRFDDLGVMFHDQHGIAGRDETVQHLQEQLDVGKVQAGRRFVEQIEGPARTLLDELPGKLDPLGLAAGKRGRRLPELHIIQPHCVQRAQLVGNGRNVLEMREGFLNVHLQDFGDRLSLVTDLQRLTVEAVTFAHRASDPDVGQKVHLQLGGTVAFTCLAATAVDVETETARLEALGLGLGQLRVEPANFVKDLDVGGRVRSGRAADRRLVDGNHLVEMLDAFQLIELAGVADAGVEVAAEGLDQDVVDQRALARAGNAGHANERPQGNLDVDVLEIVVAGAADDESPATVMAIAADGGDFDPQAAGKVRRP